MTQTRDLIKKMADFFTSEEYYEKGEDARLEFSPDDVRCVNRLIQRMSNIDKIRAMIERIADVEQKHDEKWAMGLRYAVKIIDKYRERSEE